METFQTKEQDKRSYFFTATAVAFISSVATMFVVPQVLLLLIKTAHPHLRVLGFLPWIISALSLVVLFHRYKRKDIKSNSNSLIIRNPKRVKLIFIGSFVIANYVLPGIFGIGLLFLVCGTGPSPGC
jgi:hypothetical protein